MTIFELIFTLIIGTVSGVASAYIVNFIDKRAQK